MEQKQAGNSLTYWIVVAIILAVGISIVVPWLGLAGLEAGTEAYEHRAELLFGVFEAIAIGGDIFLMLLKMMVVPLVIVSVMQGILNLGDVRKLGKPGAAAIAFYLSTTFIAVLTGLVLVNIIAPGESDIDMAQVEKMASEKGELIEEANLQVKEEGIMILVRNLVLMLFTDNLFASAVRTDLLPLIVFSVVFAGMLTTLGDRVANIKLLIDQFDHAILSFVMLLMRVAPLGIFCLVAGRFGKEMLGGTFVETLRLVWWYSVTVVVGLALHLIVTLPLILWLLTRRNPYRFLLAMGQALLTAFSTSSSSATLPVTMECATERAGVSGKAVDFVLPLGATINMDGTALYEAVAVIFIAQFLGHDLSLAQQGVVALTATLAAIGAAGIPEAGLVTMLIVLNAVGLPLKYQAIIIPVDWLLDRFRTMVNIFGDACGAAIVERTLPPDEPGPAPLAPPPTPTPAAAPAPAPAP
jgi:solute carrier family 1 (neuronal/epithelial high affinity glutamate transporter), member 1